MPSLAEIRATWDSDAGWSADGDEWSGAWGGTAPLWWSTLMPRIHAFLPARTVLELGPGHGRWSQYLGEHAERLVLVDVAQNCIEACRRRFGDREGIAYHVGDGASLPMVADASVDLAFSFDSLVHAEADVLEGYVRELGRTLAPDGVAFLHTSNMGAYAAAAARARRLPDPVRRRLTVLGAVVNVYAWRAESTTAELVAELAERSGLRCVSQELVPWEYGRHLTEVLSVLTPRGSRWDRPRVTSRNPGFMDEARAAARIARVYPGPPPAAPRSSST